MTSAQSQQSRRDLIRLLAGTPIALPLAASAQPASLPVVGYLTPLRPGADQIAAFRLGLADFGYVEGRDAIVEFHATEGSYRRLPAKSAGPARPHDQKCACQGQVLLEMNKLIAVAEFCVDE